MSKVVDGVELLRMIRDGEIKDGTEFKVNNYDSVYIYIAELGIKNKACDDYIDDVLTLKGIADAKFKILLSEDEEIDIDSIEELNDIHYYDVSRMTVKETDEYHALIANTLKDVIKAVKQLNKINKKGE